MRNRCLTIAFSFLALGCSLAAAANDAIWIDVRTAEEYNTKHVEEAVNIPYEQIAEGVQELGLGKDQTIYVYCGSGRRAGIAQQSLQDLGYEQVINAGGLEDAEKLLADQAAAASQ